MRIVLPIKQLVLGSAAPMGLRIAEPPKQVAAAPAPSARRPARLLRRGRMVNGPNLAEERGGQQDEIIPGVIGHAVQVEELTGIERCSPHLRPVEVDALWVVGGVAEVRQFRIRVLHEVISG